MNRNYYIRLLAPEDGTGNAGGGTGNPGGTGDGNQQSQSILAQKQDGPPPWFKDLPDDLKTPYVTQTKDLSAFVKSAVDTKALVGANTIKLPGDKATESEWNEFFGKLGRPSEAKDYGMTVKPIDEKLLDTATLDSMRAVFHANGLTAKQGQAILDAYLTNTNTAIQNHTKTLADEQAQSTAALQQEWGDAYTANVRTAQLAVEELGGEEVFTALDKAGLGNNPTIIKFLYSIGKHFLDDKIVGGGGNQFSGTVEGAMAEIRALSLDADFQAALNSKTHAGHNAAVDRWLKLHQTAYPSEKK